MKKGTAAIIIVVILALIGGGVYALTRNPSDNKPESTSTTQSSNDTDTSNTTDTSNPSDTTSSNQDESATIITYSNSGFSPSTITVKSGSTVTIKNTSSHSVDFASDPHPVHTDNTELNVRTVAAGETKTFTVTKTGTWGYHNHDNSSETGTIVVQ